MTQGFSTRGPWVTRSRDCLAGESGEEEQRTQDRRNARGAMAERAMAAVRPRRLQEPEQTGMASPFDRAESPSATGRAKARASIADNSRGGRPLVGRIRLASRSPARQEPSFWRSFIIASIRRSESRISMRTSVDSSLATAVDGDGAGATGFAALSSSPNTTASRCART